MSFGYNHEYIINKEVIECKILLFGIMQNVQNQEMQ